MRGREGFEVPAYWKMLSCGRPEGRSCHHYGARFATPGRVPLQGGVMSPSTAIRYILVVFIALLVTGSVTALAETNLNFVLGQKYLDADDWPVGNSQGSISFLSTFGPRSWPVQVAIDVLVSAAGSTSTLYPGSDGEIRGTELVQGTFELDIGVRKIWRSGRARPFVGGGIAVVRGQQEIQLLSSDPADISRELGEDDEAPGAWIDGGVFWRLGEMFNIGFEARYSRAELSFTGRDVQAGGFNLGLILGWGWGGGARIVE